MILIEYDEVGGLGMLGMQITETDQFFVLTLNKVEDWKKLSHSA